MNEPTLDPLDRLWRSAGNSPTPEELGSLRPRILERLRRDRRLLALRLGAGGAALAVLSVVLVASRAGAAGGSDAPGWATALLLAPPWLAFVLFLRRLLRPSDVDASAGAPIGAALEAALDATRAALARVRTVAILHLVSVPLLALALSELVASGKVRPGELRSLAFVLGGILLATAALLAHHAFARLRPRARHLESLLADLG